MTKSNPDEGSGRIIGDRFRIGQMIGQGGMATVYQGRDTLTQDDVAIKLLKPDVISADPGMVERFAREGEALRRLNHPNIVKVLATVKEGEENFVVMEYVGGGDLRDLLDEQRHHQRPLPIARVLEIALDLSDALTRAHRLKIIHRDIKPANVLLAEDGTPRLTDFGVAHFGDSTRMTQTGAMMGTLAYLSPEACSGVELDARADIWSFGVMLYEMLALRRPFEGDNSAALITSILTRVPDSLAELRPDAPPELVALVEQMLVKERDQRTASVRLVGAQLEAIISGKDLPSHVDTDNTPTLRDVARAVSDFQSGHPVTPPPSVDHGEFVPDHYAGGTVLVTPTPAPAAAHKSRRGLLIGGMIAAALAVVALIAALVILSGGDEDAPAGGPSQTSADILMVDPVDDGQYMLILGQLEAIPGTTRADPTRFIYDDLSNRFHRELVAYYNVRVRQYPGVITSAEQAAAIAQANGAQVILWGNYDDQGSRIEVQMGSLDIFAYNVFPAEALAALINARLELSDERTQSLAIVVLAAFNVLNTADSDVFGVASIIAAETLLADVPRPVIPGSSSAARWYRAIAAYIPDTDQSLAEFDAAIELDARSAILYLARGLTRQRQGLFLEASDDVSTAIRLGPDNWATPLHTLALSQLLLENSPAGVLADYDRVIALRPDWYSYMTRAFAHYLAEDYESASEDINQSLALEPQANMPYPFAISLALRAGRLAEAQALVREVLERFPDPTYAQRVMEAVYGSTGEGSIFTLSLDLFGRFILRQWNTLIQVYERAASQGIVPFPDFEMLVGMAHCNLGDYAAAEAAYTRFIDVSPEFTFLYLLRAEVRLAQGNTAGALQDVAQVTSGPQADLYAPFLPVFQRGDVTCRNFLDVDIDALINTGS